MTCYSGGCDGKLRSWNVSQPPTSVSVVGQHEAPIKEVKFLSKSNLVLTGSWDKTVRVWDCRSPNAVATAQLGERVYAMDARQTMAVVGTADKMLHVFDLSAGLNKIAAYKSPIDHQTRTVSIFADCQGFALGAIEGRIAIEHFGEMSKKNPNDPTYKIPNTPNFIFKYHRDKRADNTGYDIYSVNCIGFHPTMNTFCTAGSDGSWAMWDKVGRTKLKAFENHKGKCPISAISFAPRGNIMFYAASYDWSKGAEHNSPNYGQNIFAHAFKQDEVTPVKK
jgi:mRNA export factor